MIEVDYYLNTTSQWIIDFAGAFSKSTGAEVLFKENRLMFPPSIAKGRFDYCELSESLAMVSTDIIFQEEILLHKRQIRGNDYYALIFYMSNHPLKIMLSDGTIVSDFDGLGKSIVFSSHIFDSSVVLPKNAPLRYIQLVIHRSWVMKNLAELLPIEFPNGLPMRAVANFDIKSYELINEIFKLNIRRANLKQLLEGYACQLIALFFNNLKVNYADKENDVSEDVMRIVELKERQEQNLSQILSIVQAAKECLMSDTKFAAIFSSLFKENYGEYFIHKKMEKAKQLLNEGHTVSSVGAMLGYNNISYFAKTFSKYYGVMPKTFKKKNV